MTIEQMQIADAIDEMRVGEGIEFANGVYVERESPQRYVINGELRRYCFIEAYDKVVAT